MGAVTKIANQYLREMAEAEARRRAEVLDYLEGRTKQAVVGPNGEGSPMDAQAAPAPPGASGPPPAGDPAMAAAMPGAAPAPAPEAAPIPGAPGDPNQMAMQIAQYLSQMNGGAGGKGAGQKGPDIKEMIPQVMAEQSVIKKLLVNLHTQGKIPLPEGTVMDVVDDPDPTGQMAAQGIMNPGAQMQLTGGAPGAAGGAPGGAPAPGMPAQTKAADVRRNPYLWNPPRALPKA